jgi:hypothetical protein
LLLENHVSKQLRELQARKTTLVKKPEASPTAPHPRIATSPTRKSPHSTPCARVSTLRLPRSTARRPTLIADEARIGIQSAIGPIVTDHRETDPRRGFDSLGECMQAVYPADRPGQSPDARLLIGGIGAAAPSNFSNEAGGQDGGFLGFGVTKRKIVPEVRSSTSWRSGVSVATRNDVGPDSQSRGLSDAN